MFLKGKIAISSGFFVSSRGFPAGLVELSQGESNAEMAEKTPKVHLREYRTNEVVDVRENFSQGSLAETEDLLEVNRGFCKLKIAEKAPHSAPPNCVGLPKGI